MADEEISRPFMTDEEFIEMAEKDGVSMTLCTVSWCNQNEKIMEVFQRLIFRFSAYGVRYDFADPNTVTSLRAKYNVRSMPTILIMKDGEVYAEMVGITDEDQVIPTMYEALEIDI